MGSNWNPHDPVCHVRHYGCSILEEGHKTKEVLFIRFLMRFLSHTFLIKLSQHFNMHENFFYDV